MDFLRASAMLKHILAAVMFARNCLNSISSSDVVRYVANYGVFFGQMALVRWLQELDGMYFLDAKIYPCL